MRHSTVLVFTAVMKWCGDLGIWLLGKFPSLHEIMYNRPGMAERFMYNTVLSTSFGFFHTLYPVFTLLGSDNKELNGTEGVLAFKAEVHGQHGV
jgi:hypothetical protein